MSNTATWNGATASVATEGLMPLGTEKYYSILHPSVRVDPIIFSMLGKMEKNPSFSVSEPQKEKLKIKASLVLKVTGRINRRAGQLDDASRQLLARPAIYRRLLYDALFPNDQDAGLDEVAAAQEVLRLVRGDQGLWHFCSER